MEQSTTEESTLWLLLLTGAPSAISLANFRSAYGQALVQSLQEVSQVTKSTSVTQTLDVVVLTPGLSEGVPRSVQYTNLRDIILQLYRLLCVTFTQQSIDVENDNDVEVRIIPIGLDTNSDRPQTRSTSITSPTLSPTSIADLQLLASCKRRWKRVLAIESGEGQALLDALLRERHTPDQQAFQTFNVGKPHPETVGIDCKPSTALQKGGAKARPSPHYSVAVGGTFDHLHAGHRLLLTMTALLLEPHSVDSPGKERTLTIGITGDQLLTKKQFAEELQDWDQRQGSVADFLSAILMLDSPSRELISTKRMSDPASGARSVRDVYKMDLAIHYVELFDPFGPTITEEGISALVVSAETRSGGKAVNDRRTEKGWAALEVFEVDVLNADDYDGPGDDGSLGQDFQNKISSTAIRQKLHLRRG